jgi:predicted dehydrogenase
MNVGIIGAGTIFDVHVQAYQEIGQEVRAVADVDLERAKRVAQQYSIPLACTDWQDLIKRDDLDIIDVCTPPRFHKEIAVGALKAGKHVVCEKPLGPNLADVDEILQAEADSAGKLLVVHQLRYSIFYQRLKWLITAGHLGKIHFARVQRYDPPPAELVKQGTWGNWELAGGGVLMTKAIHQLDMLLGLLGKPRRVEALMGTFAVPIESEDHLTANIEFENGALANVSVSGQAYGGYGQHFDLFGSGGSCGQPWNLRLKNREQESTVLEELDRRFPIAAPPRSGWKHLARRIGGKLGMDLFNVRQGNGHTPILREFVEALRDSRAMPVTGEDGRSTVELCTAIYASALSRQVVDLPLDASTCVYRGVTLDDYRSACTNWCRQGS